MARMDIDIGNIVYILITLVALSLGLLGRKKKKRPGGVPGEGGGKPQSGFMDNLEKVLASLGQEEPGIAEPREQEPDLAQDEFLFGPSVEPVKQQAQEFEQIPEFEPAEEPAGLTGDYELVFGEKAENESGEFMEEGEKATGPLEVIDLDTVEGVDFFRVIKDFDAGTAIVYSAIINSLDY
jgi:hypothetical protein